MKLHYSQTVKGGYHIYAQFDYHMKLHYSQTDWILSNKESLFDYHMKLHEVCDKPSLYILDTSYDIYLCDCGIHTYYTMRGFYLKLKLLGDSPA